MKPIEDYKNQIEYWKALAEERGREVDRLKLRLADEKRDADEGKRTRAEVERLRKWGEAGQQFLAERDELQAEVERLRASQERCLGIAKTAEQEADESTKAAWAEVTRLRAQLAAEREGVKRYSAKWRDAEARLAKVVEIIEREAPVERRERIFERHPHLKAILAAAQPEEPKLEFDCAHEPGTCLGHCSTCGLEVEEGVTHECPPGFQRAAQPEEERLARKPEGRGSDDETDLGPASQ